MKLRLFVLFSCLYLGVASREPPWGDAHVVYETTQRLVDELRIDVNLGGPTQFYAVRRDPKTRRELKYGVFPLGNVIAMAPSYVVYKVLAKIPRAPTDLLFKYTCHLSPSLLMAGALVLFFAMARREGASERAATWLTLGLGLSTILLVYARSPYSEALQTLCFTFVADRALKLGERPSLGNGLLAGLACGLLVNTKLIYALVVPVVALHAIVQHRRRIPELARSLGAGMVPLALLVFGAMAHNHLKTGSWTDSGYSIPEGVFSGDAYAALDGYFLSTGKSVFLYSPLLLLGVLGWMTMLQRNKGRAILVAALFGVITLANAKFRYWHADYCWGPRLLVPMAPLMLLPAAPWIEGALRRGRRRARGIALGVLVGGGLFAQLLGSAFYWDHYIRIAIAVKDQTGAPGWFGEDLHHCHFIPQFSPLVGHAWLLRHLVWNDDDVLVDAPFRRVAWDKKLNLTNEFHAVRPDWWGCDWFASGGAPILGVVLLLGLGGGAAWSVVGMRRRFRLLVDENRAAAG